MPDDMEKLEAAYRALRRCCRSRGAMIRHSRLATSRGTVAQSGRQ
jgi:hypothetical protein